MTKTATSTSAPKPRATAVGKPRAKPQPKPDSQTTHGVASPKGKMAALVTLLRKDDGATIEAMTTATGWQAHSVRGAISGAIKKKLGLKVASTKTETGRVYRIVPRDAA